MATYTSYLNLEKPTTSETFNLLKMNQNWDKIDAGVSALNSKLFYGISSSTDFNSLTNNGIYTCPYYSNGSAAHRPINSAGILMVHRVSDSAYTQTYTTYSNPVEVFTRIYTNNAWTEWNSKIMTLTFTATSDSNSDVELPTTIQPNLHAVMSMICTSEANIVCNVYRPGGSKYSAYLTNYKGDVISSNERTYEVVYYVKS